MQTSLRRLGLKGARERNKPRGPTKKEKARANAPIPE